MSEIVLPRLGWNMEHGVFLGWLKADGATVQVGEPLFAVEGDKATQEIEALVTGTLRIASTCPATGATVPVGTVLGHLETTSTKCVTSPASLAPVASPSVRHAARALGIDITQVLGQGPGGRITMADLQPQGPHVTPRARRIAREHGLDLSSVTGTGKGGRIRERDVLARVPAKSTPTNRRQAIAANLLHSVQNTVPVTLTTTADATNLLSLRAQLKTRGGVVPSVTDLFAKLVALALAQHADMNARWTEQGVERLSAINIGIAVDTDAGLLVPVLHDVPSLSLTALATRSAELIQQARTGTLPHAAMQGGTFTITNLGAYGIDAFTPIIRWPECAILGLGAIRPQPTVHGQQVVISDMVTLSLTFDHRIVDGAPAARFLQTVVNAVTNAAAWLVG